MIMMILNITAVKEIDSLDMLRRQSVIEKLLQRYPDFCSQIYTNQAHRRIPNLPSLNNCTMLIHFVRNRFCKIMFYGVHLFTFTLLNAHNKQLLMETFVHFCLWDFSLMITLKSCLANMVCQIKILTILGVYFFSLNERNYVFFCASNNTISRILTSRKVFIVFIILQVKTVCVQYKRSN